MMCKKEGEGPKHVYSIYRYSRKIIILVILNAVIYTIFQIYHRG